MKKRKLTKEQIEKRKHFLKVTKNVVFYISLALNAIVLIALCVGGCSSSKANVRQTNDDNIALLDVPQIEKNKKVNDFDIYSNGQTICYDLTTLNITSRDYISTGNYHYFSTTSNIILFGGDGVVWSDVNEIYVDFNVDGGGVAGNFIQIRAQHRSNDGTTSYTVAGRYWGYSNGAWATQDLPNNSGYNTYNGFYIGFNFAQTNDNQFGLIGLLEHCFNEVEYKDLDLFQGWNPYAFTSQVAKDVIAYPNQSAVVNLVHSCIFSINGYLYDRIQLVLSPYGANTQYYDGTQVVKTSTDTERIIIGVNAINSATNRTLVLMSRAVYTNVDTNGVGVYLADTSKDLYFNNGDVAKVRLFAINLSYTSNFNSNYTNGQIFTTSYSGYNVVGQGSGQFGDVFGLVSNAFTGVASILSLQILPNITLGVFLMLPLVAMIIFAIVKVVKK